MVRIVVSGAEGKMGKRIIALAKESKDFEVAGALELKSNLSQGIEANLAGIKKPYDCIIEFTSPKATLEHVKEAAEFKKAIVIGTTGLSENEIKIIKEYSSVIPIVFSPNMSVGVNTLFTITGKAAEILGKGYRVSIKEAHHIHKKDSPSGTAKLMAEIAKEKSGCTDIPTESIREGEIVGDHEIVFESDVDILKISHSAKTRDIFALGALKAASFAATKKSGIFSMQDVLAKN